MLHQVKIADVPAGKVKDKGTPIENISKFNILLDYIIFGGYYAFEENTKFDNNSDEIINTLIRATTHMNKLFTDGN